MQLLTQPGARALGNARHEAFAQHYAGDCWANGAEAVMRSGFHVRNRQCASVQASRLMRRPDISARIKVLRAEAAELLGVDRLAILERRWAIAKSPDTPAGDVLTACLHLEKSLGLAVPERVVVRQEVTGKVEHGITLDPRTRADLWTYVASITAEARALETATPEQLADHGRRIRAQDKPLPLPPATAPAPGTLPQLTDAARDQLQRTLLVAPIKTGGAPPSSPSR